jgi:PAS domain S-box-containing protein
MSNDTSEKFGENFPHSLKDKVSKILLKAIETTGEMVIVTDAPEIIGEEKIIFVNNAFEEITQYSKEEVYGKSPSFLQGSETDYDVIRDLKEKLSNGERFEGETFNYKKDGSVYRVRWSIDPIYNDEGEITHFVSVQRDVTEEWERHQKMQKIINQRENLVKETHHRIKNNLATITGLLELQIMKSKSDEVRNVLSESMNRVSSIASIHEKLYETEGLSSITLDVYIKDLVEQIRNSLENIGGISDINFELDLNPISLSIQQAVPLGLILNELVTNAHKHAFDEERGTISISCQADEDKIYLKVKDNGKGLPEDLEIQNTNSLGLKLIDTLCRQLDGEYNLSSENGTKFLMYFTKKHLSSENE